MPNALIITTLIMLASTAQAVELPEVVTACIEKNSPARGSVQTIELRARDRSGYEQVLQANTYLKRTADAPARILMHFNEPVDIRGARFLIIENSPQNDMYMYMPGLFKVRKITSKRISSSILGTDFSYEDYERLHGVFSDLRAEQADDALLGGRPVHVINSYPEADSGYDRITTYIDTETCVSLRTELYENDQQLRKVLSVSADDIRKTGNIFVPHMLLMKDLRDKTETRMIVEDVQIDVPLDDALFDPEQLKKIKVPAIQAD